MLILLKQIIQYTQVLGSLFSYSSVDNKIDLLTIHNIDETFDRAPCYYEHHQKSSDFKIYEKPIETKNNLYQVFKIVRNNEKDYFYLDYKKRIGQGGYGTVYQGTNVKTGKMIVIKRLENVYKDEIQCLKKYGTYIAHTWNQILIEKAPGISYEDILKNESISDGMKIELHKKILDKIIELHEKYKIIHGDMKPEHIFIDENENITFVDFGLSVCCDTNSVDSNTVDSNAVDSRCYDKTNYYLKKDINKLNRVTKDQVKCGKLFSEYIESLFPNTILSKFISNIFQFSRL